MKPSDLGHKTSGIVLTKDYGVDGGPQREPL